MKTLTFYFVSPVIIFYLIGQASKAPGEFKIDDYQEECLNEGCNAEEVRELHSSYNEECLNEGCSNEEVRELAGTGSAIIPMIQDFQRRGFRIDPKHLQLTNCVHERTDTACTGVVFWCNDRCRFPDGSEGGSGWYPCGVCFGFSF